MDSVLELSKLASESEKTEGAVHIRSLFIPCRGANRTETAKRELEEMFVHVDLMKSPPAVNLDQRLCIQVRGQSFGEKSSALEAVPRPPQDPLSCKTHCSSRSSCFPPAAGVSWVLFQRTFEEWDGGCGRAPGAVEALEGVGP